MSPWQFYMIINQNVPELIVCESSISIVITAGKEPATVFRINKEALSWAHILLLGDRENLGATIARSCLGRPNTHLPPVVEDKASGTAVLEDGVVVLILVEFDTTVESKHRNFGQFRQIK